MINNHFYLNKEVNYIKNIYIYEYDLKSAGLSVLKHNKVISDNAYEIYKTMDKNKRNISIGLLCRKYPELNTLINDELQRVREEFMTLNNIEDSDILSIKRDAIFVIDKFTKHNVINDNFTFAQKNKYTSYLYINDMELYYNEQYMDIKNISDKARNDHKDYLINLFRRVLKVSELNTDKNIIYKYLKNIKHDYLNFDLDVNYYRELTNDSLYKVNILHNTFTDNLGDEEKYYLDIEYNYMHYILKLFNYLL